MSPLYKCATFTISITNMTINVYLKCIGVHMITRVGFTKCSRYKCECKTRSMNAPFGMPPSKSISSSKIDIFARERLILQRTKSSLYQGLSRQDYVKQN